MARKAKLLNPCPKNFPIFPANAPNDSSHLSHYLNRINFLVLFSANQCFMPRLLNSCVQNRLSEKGLVEYKKYLAQGIEKAEIYLTFILDLGKK
jgi:hypothetical protein